MSKAKEAADAQRAAARAHHKARVAWLSQDAPKWACGTPVLPSERQTLLRQSVQYLKSGAGFNHCHCVPRCGATT